MTDGQRLLAAIDANPGEWTPVRMLADWLDENALPESAAMVRDGQGWLGDGYGYGDGGGGGGGGDGYGDGGGDGGYGYGDGDGGGGGGDGGYGYGDGDGGGDGDGDGGGYGGGYGDGYGGGDGYGYGDGGYGDGGGYGDYILSRGFVLMEATLYIICSPGGYYPYVRVGWCSRQDGLIAMQNVRVIKRFGTLAELVKIAEEGPKDTTQLLSMAKLEGVSAGLVSRIIPCNPEAWAEQCPRPKQKAAAILA